MFIKLSDFSIKDLPAHLQMDEVFEYITCHASLVVRLRVNTFGQCDAGLSDCCEGGILRGTGSIFEINPTAKPCRCEDCHGKPRRDQPASWTFKVKTALHVLSNDGEASGTTVDLFYDSETSAKNGEMQSVKGTIVLYTNKDRDLVIFSCITHDVVLAEKIKVQLEQCERLKHVIRDQYSTARPDSVVIIVSHPHGAPKHVTLGELGRKDTFKEVLGEKHTYTADTCLGSSGAPVLAVIRGIKWTLKPDWKVHHCRGVSDAGNCWNIGFWG